MKIAFISDIHGNAIALESVLEDIQKKQAEKIYVLGDLCYRGPEPKRSLEIIRSLNTEVIKGNADEWVVRGVKEGEVPDQVLGLMNLERDWTVSKLGTSDLTYMKELPTEIQTEVHGISIHAFHATPDSLFDVIPPSADDEVLKERFMSTSDSQIYIYAHIHKPYIRYVNGRVIMNIGSVGLPFDGSTRASYAMVEIEENRRFSTSIERVSYDLEKAMKKYEEVQYPNARMMMGVLAKGSL